MNKRVYSRLLSPRLLFVVLTALAAATTTTGVIGAQNATGAPATTGAPSSLGIVVNWNPTVTYKAGQVVYCADCSTNGSKYIALLPNLNVDPPSNLNVIWKLVTETSPKGDTGAAGTTGSTGEPAHPPPPPPPPPPPSTPPVL